MFKRKSFKGGVTIPHNKNTSNCETIKMPVPPKVVIPMSQHIGAPCNPIVKKGDFVKVGQLIGEPVGFVSSPILALSVLKGCFNLAPQPDINISSTDIIIVFLNICGLIWNNYLSLIPRLSI